MKMLSSSIIVLTGGIIFSAGTLNSGDTKTVTCLIGAMLGIYGLVGWFVAAKQNE